MSAGYDLQVLETDEELQGVLTSSADCLFIVKFGAVWCKACNDIQPFIDNLIQELANKDRNTQVVLVDRTDDNDELFSTHQITKLPTVLIIKNKAIRVRLERPDPEHMRSVVVSMIEPRDLVLNADF